MAEIGCVIQGFGAATVFDFAEKCFGEFKKSNDFAYLTPTLIETVDIETDVFGNKSGHRSDRASKPPAVLTVNDAVSKWSHKLLISVTN